MRVHCIKEHLPTRCRNKSNVSWFLIVAVMYATCCDDATISLSASTSTGTIVGSYVYRARKDIKRVRCIDDVSTKREYAI